jgi:antitoxin HicB
MSKSKVEEILTRAYARVITPAEEGGFVAEIVEFPGCFTQAETVEEAYRNLEDAARGWLHGTIELGQPIPEPMAEQEFSGKVVLRLPKSMHRKASAYAEADGVSLNTFLATAIAERIGERIRQPERESKRQFVKDPSRHAKSGLDHSALMDGAIFRPKSRGKVFKPAKKR